MSKDNVNIGLILIIIAIKYRYSYNRHRDSILMAIKHIKEIKQTTIIIIIKMVDIMEMKMKHRI